MAEESPIDIYVLFFMAIVGVGSIAVYVYYLRDKSEQLQAIQQGKCPKCHRETIEITDTRGGGCGPKLVTYSCTECGYANSFSIDGNCGI